MSDIRTAVGPADESEVIKTDGVGRGSVTVTRREAESLIWHQVKPPAAPRHFDSVVWDTHKVTFTFHYHDQVRDYKHEGPLNVNVYFHKGTGEPEVIGYEPIEVGS